MIAFLLVAIAGLCKAVSDTLSHHFLESIFARPNAKNDGTGPSWTAWQWWDPSISWKNKYDWDAAGKAIKKEKFLGSTTVFSWLTDGWHFFNMIQYTAFIMAIILYTPVSKWWVDAILLKCVFTITFEIFYKYVLKKSYER